VQNCWKEKKKRRAIVTWLRHEGIGNDCPFKLLTKSWVPLSCPTPNKGEEKRERPEQPKPNFLSKSDLIKSY